MHYDEQPLKEEVRGSGKDSGLAPETKPSSALDRIARRVIPTGHIWSLLVACDII